MMYDRGYYEYEDGREGLWEAKYYWEGRLRPDQEAAIEYVFMEDPGVVASIGCGMCLAEKEIAKRAKILCFDPSDYVCEKLDFVIQADLEKAASCGADTWLFIESLEHIPIEQIDHFLNTASGRVVVTNHLNVWPINKNGKDHITVCDDALYDRITHGKKVVVRNGPHLVFHL